MSKINDGFITPHNAEGSVNPEAPCVATQPHYQTSTDGSSDISIRDYFAAAALQGLLAYYGGFCDQDAKAAYAAADAMLKAKEAKP